MSSQQVNIHMQGQTQSLIQVFCIRYFENWVCHGVGHHSPPTGFIDGLAQTLYDSNTKGKKEEKDTI